MRRKTYLFGDIKAVPTTRGCWEISEVRNPNTGLQLLIPAKRVRQLKRYADMVFDRCEEWRLQGMGSVYWEE